MKRILTGLVLALLTFGALMLTAPAAQATWVSPPAGAFKTIEYNIGSGAECSPPEDCLAMLETQVASYAPHFVLGTEFCYSDYVDFKAWIQGRSQTSTWDVEYSANSPHKIPGSGASTSPDPKSLGCQDASGVNESKGIVLAGDFGSIYRYDLAKPYINMFPELDPLDPTNPNNPDAGSAQYYPLLCATPAVTTGGPTRVCVTHLVAGQETDQIALRKQELRTIQNLKDGVARDDNQNLVGVAWSRPEIGGDFNSNTDDAYWNNFKQDDLYCWSVDSDPNDCTPGAQGSGTYTMTDTAGETDAPNSVDHVLYRNTLSPTSSQMSVASPPNYSTHALRKSWVKY